MVLFIQNVHDEEITLKKNQIPRSTLGFHFLDTRMGAHMLCFRKKYDPDICHFLIVLHDQCNLDFEYSKTYKTL